MIGWGYMSEANFPVSGLPLSERSLWATAQPANWPTPTRLLLRFYFRRAGAVAGAAAFLATTSRGEPAADQPAGSDPDDSPDDDGFGVHVRRMTT